MRARRNVASAVETMSGAVWALEEKVAAIEKKLEHILLLQDGMCRGSFCFSPEEN